MVAYSFKQRFVGPINVGLGQYDRLSADGSLPPAPKRQTIRAIGKRRHARPGETVQLYYGMRTKQCRLIGVARCTDVRTIVITLEKQGSVAIGGTDGERYTSYAGSGLDIFARADGFISWADMVQFWAIAHGGTVFIGKLIEWKPIK